MKTRLCTFASISLLALAAQSPADEAKPAAKPEPAAAVAPAATAPPRDPTLIDVPTNTLGPGTPLWVRRDQEQAQSRLAKAEADYAEARADLARVEAQRAADDRYFSASDGVVIYGPHQPGLSRALFNRPFVPTHIARPISQTTDRATGGINDQDPFAAAQFRFFNAANPPIAPIINAQLDSQRRVSMTPPIIEPQKQRDNTVLNARKPAPKP